jgi:hypothetical protein
MEDLRFSLCDASLEIGKGEYVYQQLDRLSA